MNYVFEPRLTLSEVLAKFFYKRFHYVKLPPKFKGYDFSIESGLSRKPDSKLKFRLVLIISLFIALPFIWGIKSSSDASMIMNPKFMKQNTLIIPLNLPQVNPSNVSQKPFDCKTGQQAATFTVHCQIKSPLAKLTDIEDFSKPLVAQFLKIFKPTIDIEREKQIDDQFSLIYKQKGKTSEILAAEYSNNGKIYRAIRYTDKKTKTTDYYTPAGERLQKISLLSIPVKKITRISSPFGMRKHPILKIYKFHTGIDYAAAWGTPVFAGGDATVKFIGRKHGYGKVISLEHHQRVISLYAHLSKFAKNLQVGNEVKQGEIIGYIGQSGRATGPHLHYEIRVDDKPINPEQFAKSPLTLTITKKHQADFLKHSHVLTAKLDNLNYLSPTTIQLAQNNH